MAVATGSGKAAGRFYFAVACRHPADEAQMEWPGGRCFMMSVRASTLIVVTSQGVVDRCNSCVGIWTMAESSKREPVMSNIFVSSLFTFGEDGVRTKNAFSLPIHKKQQKFVCNVQVCFLFLLFYRFPDIPTIARSSS